jgi:hypothetical protein
LRPHINKKKSEKKKGKEKTHKKTEKILEENKNIYISEKIILEHPRNDRTLV